MSSQRIKANLLATGIFAASVCGTFALFGCVPMLARLTSNKPHEAPEQQQQVFPEVSRRQELKRSALPDATDADSLSDRIRRQARAIYPNAINPNTINPNKSTQRPEQSPQRRSAL